jgi:hypothetical protein
LAVPLAPVHQLHVDAQRLAQRGHSGGVTDEKRLRAKHRPRSAASGQWEPRIPVPKHRPRSEKFASKSIKRTPPVQVPCWRLRTTTVLPLSSSDYFTATPPRMRMRIALAASTCRKCSRINDHRRAARAAVLRHRGTGVACWRGRYVAYRRARAQSTAT